MFGGFEKPVYLIIVMHAIVSFCCLARCFCNQVSIIIFYNNYCDLLILTDLPALLKL
jgi:hypothetical protein